ncbi:putative 5-methylthioadenosine/S-adenosylhomocysteine deaminase [Blattamonas nauphoetae]|uniref:5-methylthioadenosine/S-adenosylhomocysteine deaminase n=1 Tax=Blattamonas nauphoetae TaxID=2049346 RepID=A0ABQ9X9A6_9EUKA|nr:putative 5-methylthioadenosine/S-adenosylhomocysteine deaminase [Blattamonas nauphoetae]
MSSVPVPQPQTQFLVVRADFLVALSDYHADEERIVDGYVLCEGDKIKESGHFTTEIGDRILKEYGHSLTVIGKNQEENSSEDIPRLRAVILPGFVKAHGHDHESTIIGLCRDVPLTDWLDGVINPFNHFLLQEGDNVKKHFGKHPNLIAYRKSRLDDVSYGITSSLTHHCNFNKYYTDLLVQANVEAGTKMIAAIGSQDRNYDPKILDIPAEKATDRLDHFSQECRDAPRTQIIPGPDQVFSNSAEILRAEKEWAREHGTLIQIHSAEEFNTTQWFREKYQMTEIEYLDSIGFLDENTILAHQVHSTPSEIDLIAKRGVKVVHNPLANTILGSGMPDIITMLEKGVQVAISTDGSGSADNQNIIAAARCASQYQRALHHNARLLPAKQVLEMITRVPAKMLRLNAGQIAPGFDADLAVLDLTRINMIPTTKENVIENIIWAADGSEVRWVIANGMVLRDNYQITIPGATQTLQEMIELQRMYLDYLPTAKKIIATGRRATQSE